MKKIATILLSTFLLTACNSSIEEGTVVEKKKTTFSNGDAPKCVLFVVEDKQAWESTPEQERKKPEEVKVKCDKAFDDIKPGDHWKKPGTD